MHCLWRNKLACLLVANLWKHLYKKSNRILLKEWSPHQDSNLEQPLRRRQFYPVKLWGAGKYSNLTPKKLNKVSHLNSYLGLNYYLF